MIFRKDLSGVLIMLFQVTIEINNNQEIKYLFFFLFFYYFKYENGQFFFKQLSLFLFNFDIFKKDELLYS